jgi:hypothetical protein
MKFPFLKSKQVKPLSYLGIFLTSTEGVVFLMQCENDAMHIIDSEDFSYTHGWDQIEEDIDNALSLIEAKGSNLPDETIFFVYSHFIDKHSDHIKKEFLDKIKKSIKKS